jgi:hypothetical protein
MPRPIFDVEQYELRGIEPEVYTKDQQISLRKALARTHGQMDWTAQLLGFNGTNYWGLANPKSDHTYNWVGLPQTMNEKRQMQTGAFGVYGKDKEYVNWPSPFNRSSVKASADYRFHIWEKDGKTMLSALGQVDDLDYLDDPCLIVGGNYIFDAEVEFEILYGGDQDSSDPSIVFYTEYDENVWTRMEVKRFVNGSITVKIKGSKANALALRVSNWKDISDWHLPEVQKQFLGVWGNKGSQLSTDFLFDSLDLHSSEEHHSLRLTSRQYLYTIEDLLNSVGLEPTSWTGLYPEKFLFRIEGCEEDIAPKYPVLGNGPGNPWYGDKYWPPAYIKDREEISECYPDCNTWAKSWQNFEDELYDNGEFPALCPTDSTYIDYDNDLFANNPQAETLLDDFTYHDPAAKGGESEGFYNRNAHPPFPTDCDEDYQFPRIDDNLDNGTFEALGQALLLNSTYESVDEGIYDRNPFSGITSFEFTWDALNAAGWLNPPCLSWVFDPVLDNGTLEESLHNLFPAPLPDEDDWLWTDGPWATANDGVYDENEDIYLLVADNQADICNPLVVWKGFDDGEFDDYSNICGCEEGPVIPPDPGTLCEIPSCYVPPEDHCETDGGDYTFIGPPNYDEDCECEVECCEVDNEEIPPPPPYTGPNIVDDNIYTAICSPPANPDIITWCEVEPVWIKMQGFDEALLNFQPSVNNSYYPLRTWKNHVLVQTDTVPVRKGHHEFRNFLVADTNSGPEPEDSYRSFVRLPAEYVREGKEWSRAVQVCNNQIYFSAPKQLTEVDVRGKKYSPRNYETLYRTANITDTIAVYHEDYLYSESYEDFSEASQGSFESSVVSFEEPRPIPFHYGTVSDYDHLEARRVTKEGDWKGKYYRVGTGENLTGHVSTDLESGLLIDIPTEEYPTYDESALKRPNITFPEENPLVKESNYLVGYAYFTADLSASEEAVFDPELTQCWRNPLVDNETLVNGECVYSPLESNTSYLLHPTPLDPQRVKQKKVLA